MKRFKNILFLADSFNATQADSAAIKVESAALQRAVELARINQGALTVISVVEPLERIFGDHPALQPELAQLTIDTVESRIGELVERVAPYRDDRATISVRVLTGTPFIEAIRAVQRDHFDLLITTARGQSGPFTGLFGSHDLHLLRKCPCPLWIHKPSPAAAPYRRVVAAIDPVDQEAPELVKLILDLATSLGDREDAIVHVAHAWHLEGESLLRNGLLQLPTLELERLLAETRQRHLEALQEAIKPYGFDPEGDQVHLLDGQPARAIADLTQEIKADLIVMGTVGRTGVAGFFMGNTAENVLQAVNCSVLAVKPQGFRTPVTIDH